MLGHASMAITPVLMRTLHNPKGRRIAEGKASLYSRTFAFFLRVHLGYQVLDYSLQCPKIGVVDVLTARQCDKARQSHLASALSTPNDSATSVRPFSYTRFSPVVCPQHTKPRAEAFLPR